MRVSRLVVAAAAAGGLALMLNACSGGEEQRQLSPRETKEFLNYLDAQNMAGNRVTGDEANGNEARRLNGNAAEDGSRR